MWYNIIVENTIPTRILYHNEKRNSTTNFRRICRKNNTGKRQRKIIGRNHRQSGLKSALRNVFKNGRKWATEPSVMLKILVYANMQGIYASREIEKACKRDINFMWLLGGKKAPDYHEIARFRSGRLSECGDEIFYQIVKKLSAIGEIKLEHLLLTVQKSKPMPTNTALYGRKAQQSTKLDCLKSLKSFMRNYVQSI